MEKENKAIKKENCDVESDVRCDCGKMVKANLANRKPSTAGLECFTCHQMKANVTNNQIRTAKEIRRNPHLRSQKRWSKAIPLRTALQF